MMYLGKDAVGINRSDFLAHGEFTAETTAASTEIDTGVIGWKHFLIVVKSLPYTNQDIRAIGLRYVNVDGNYQILDFGSSSGQNYPDNAYVKDLSERVSINGTKIKWTGIASQNGQFIQGITYEWWCW